MPPKKSKKAPSPSPDVQPKRSSRVKAKDDKAEDKKKKVVKKDSPSPSPQPVKPAAKAAAKKADAKVVKAAAKGKKDVKAKSPSPSLAKAAPRKSNSKNKKSDSPPPAKKVQVEESKDIKKVVLKGAAPVDEFCLNAENFRVVEDGGIVYDCSMNQTNIVGGSNNNKFYIVQVLEDTTKPGNFWAYNRWGRVGVEGQKCMKGPWPKEKAIKDYLQKVAEKSQKGDYTIIKKDYTAEADDGADKVAAAEKKEQDALKSSKLHPKLKDLVRLIYDMKMINNQMREIGYDAKKMPLGKLAKSTIDEGYRILKKIAEAIKSKAPRQQLEILTSEFYSNIPHDFGFQRAPIIEKDQQVKAKLEMLESIEQIQVATRILENADDGNMIDNNYEKLQTNITYIEPNSDKYKLIKEYIENTHAQTHGNYSLDILDIYELQKDSDDKRFKKDLGNRRLLWHGSRLTNFVGILSQGLRIAPPEAPVTGYMFGKGVYFADMVSKSANYCGVSKENNVGCILLADVALGGLNEKLYADYNASNLPPGKHATWGKGRTGPPESSYIPMIGMPEVQVPIGKGVDTKVGGSLLYNEFIVYDVAQVRLKYLIKMKWNYK